LKRLIDQLRNPNASYSELASLYHQWSGTEISGNVPKEDRLSAGCQVPYALFLHLFHQPEEKNPLIHRFLKECFVLAQKDLESTVSGSITRQRLFFTCRVPLLTPKYRKLTIVNCFVTPNDLTILEEYWKYYSALILRTLGFMSTRMLNLRAGKDELKFKRIFSLEQLIRSHIDSYVDLCINPSVLQAFKDYQGIMNSLEKSRFKGYSELYAIYRGGIMEKRLRAAEKKFAKFPQSKLFRKRVNRRHNRLMEFAEDFFDLYSFFVLETIFVLKSFEKSDARGRRIERGAGGRKTSNLSEEGQHGSSPSQTDILSELKAILLHRENEFVKFMGIVSNQTRQKIENPNQDHS
ncbi:MAG TPA: hypothetical protein VJ044_00095, partial [Candidatus Hodarchaeales archaeon]|nr:hypothetical protein [Candidatus Hodarchaeales archaeon]